MRKPIEEYKPTDMSMLALQPLGEDAHFFNLAQCDPDLYGTQPIKAALVYGCNPIKWWGNHDEQIEMLKNLDFIVGVDLFLNESSYLYDVFLPEANYLERIDPLPHMFFNHRVICGLDVPWAYPIMQPVVEPKDGVKSIFEIMGRSCRPQGHDRELRWAYEHGVPG